MKLLYISCHSILEYDELKLFSDLGINVFSAGAYSNPQGHPSLPRPSIHGLQHHIELERAASTIRSNGNSIPQEVIDWADVVMFMHEPEMVYKNWSKLINKRVIFRSIGQCVPHQEEKLAELKIQGLQIVRYSPKERNIPNFAGEDALIRFYKDPFEFNNWNGKTPKVLNFTQSLKERAKFCHYTEILGSCKQLPLTVYGNSNDNLGDISGGELSYEDMKQAMRDYRAYIYGGTWPASYTLSFIEAWMTGIPIVAISSRLAEPEGFMPLEFYEVDELIENGVNGYIGDSISELKGYLKLLLEDEDLALKIGNEGRKSALQHFGYRSIRQQWESFLGLA